MLPTSPQLNVAYAAGIFDGEGSVAAYIGSGPNRDGLNYSVSVWQSQYELLYWMKSNFGGGVYGRNGAGYGANSRKVCGEWRATGHKAHAFLVSVRPFLIVKAANADYMLRIWEIRLHREGLLECLRNKG